MPRAASQEAIVNRGKGSPALSYRSSIEAFPRRYPALAALLLGVAAACGFAPLEYWWLAIAAFAGWIALVHAAPTRGQALWRGWSFGVGHFTINDNWFQHAFTFQDQMPPWLGYAAPFALALYLAVFPALCAGLAWRVRAPATPSWCGRSTSIGLLMRSIHDVSCCTDTPRNRHRHALHRADGLRCRARRRRRRS